MPKIFQTCQETPRGLAGISADFPNYYSTTFAKTYQLETLECPSNPLKDRTIA